MTQAKYRFASFEEYLSHGNDDRDKVRYELIEGELIQLPPESGLNNLVVRRLMLALISNGIDLELIVLHSCEVQVPVLQPKDAANRYPDLVILREEHLELTQHRLTITSLMPPPRLIVEVVSPGKTNRDRDYINKQAQYAAIGVPEYWLIDPAVGTVLVLQLQDEAYVEVGVKMPICKVDGHSAPLKQIMLNLTNQPLGFTPALTISDKLKPQPNETFATRRSPDQIANLAGLEPPPLSRRVLQ